jgi:hypothetical protein
MQFTDTPAVGVLEVSDVSGQRKLTASDVPPDTTVGELIEGLLAEMRLNREDSTGRPVAYRARLEREGRHLHASELVGDALHTGDELVLHPNIDAGGPGVGRAGTHDDRRPARRPQHGENTSA